jgi:hypothetical protein
MRVEKTKAILHRSTIALCGVAHSARGRFHFADITPMVVGSCASPKCSHKLVLLNTKASVTGCRAPINSVVSNMLFDD